MSLETDALYSVVIPVYNSEAIIGETIDRTTDFFARNNLRYELVLVNDGSRDNSWMIISEKARGLPHVTAINLLKNYGQHNANMCGFKHTSGDFVITMDDDLQNPPEEIDKLIRKVNEGYDLVIGQFKQKQHKGYRKIGSKLVGLVNRKIFQTPVGIVLTNFRIIRRPVVDKVCDYKTSYPYIPGLVIWFSQDITNTLVEHHPRRVGKSNYNGLTILKLISTILFNYSSYPLRLVTLTGMIMSFLSMFLGVGYIVNSLIAGTNVQGWTTIVVLLSFFNGISLLVISMIGEYLVRLLNQSSSSESFHIKEMVTK
jgi:polyisoprenyl-phosphate glycosyltransferase